MSLLHRDEPSEAGLNERSLAAMDKSKYRRTVILERFAIGENPSTLPASVSWSNDIRANRQAHQRFFDILKFPRLTRSGRKGIPKARSLSWGHESCRGSRFGAAPIDHMQSLAKPHSGKMEDAAVNLVVGPWKQNYERSSDTQNCQP
jgi:hypothetical protein